MCSGYPAISCILYVGQWKCSVARRKPRKRKFSQPIDICVWLECTTWYVPKALGEKLVFAEMAANEFVCLLFTNMWRLISVFFLPSLFGIWCIWPETRSWRPIFFVRRAVSVYRFCREKDEAFMRIRMNFPIWLIDFVERLFLRFPLRCIQNVMR